MVLKLKDISVGYSGRKNKIILDKINIDATGREIVALVGLNGSGKSTLLKTISKKTYLLAVQIFFYKKNYMDFNSLDYAKKISFVSTKFIKIKNLTVYDLVSLGRFPHTGKRGRLTKNDNLKIQNALRLTETLKFADKFTNQISDGEYQKVMIARAIAQDTNIILLDEPTAFLDIENKIKLTSIFKNITENENKTIIYSTHDLNNALKISDKIWLIKNKNILQASPEDLILAGELSTLFSDKNIFFDNNSYNFASNIGNTKPIILQNSTNDKNLESITKKALERNNFFVSGKSDLKVNITKENAKVLWNVKYLSENKKLKSIYDLSNFIKTTV